MSQVQAPPVEHPMLAAVGLLQAALPAVDASNFWSMTDAEMGEFADQLAAFEARLASWKLSWVGDADCRGIGKQTATDTAGWLVSRQRVRPGSARRQVRLARALREDCPATGTALAATAVNAEQAETIVGVLAHLPTVEPAVEAAAEEFLIEQAAVLNPIELRKVGQELCERLTFVPDPEQRARRQRERRGLSLIRDYDGMTLLRGLLDPEAAATLTAALDPLAAPLPAAEDGTPDLRSPGQRRADALTDLAQMGLASGKLPASGGVKPSVVVTMDLDVLTGRITGTGLLPDGEPLSASAARRIACDTQIIPVILNGKSQPLDIGRAARTIPDGIRRALVVRDQACAFPNCDRPPAWAEGHHIKHWSQGGTTALHNLALLCGQHHQAVHDDGWTVALDKHGLPYFRPPPWIDPDQTPRQHHRYRLRRLGPDPPGH